MAGNQHLRRHTPPFVARAYRAMDDAVGQPKERLERIEFFVDVALKTAFWLLDTARVAAGQPEPGRVAALLDKLDRPALGDWFHAVQALCEADLHGLESLRGPLDRRSFRKSVAEVIRVRNEWAHPDTPRTEGVARQLLGCLDVEALEECFAGLALPIFVVESEFQRSSADVMLVRRFAGLEHRTLELPANRALSKGRPWLVLPGGDVLFLEPGIVYDQTGAPDLRLLRAVKKKGPQYGGPWSRVPEPPPRKGRPFVQDYRQRVLVQSALTRDAARLLDPDADAPPDLPGYRFERVLGKGTRGEVWSAVDRTGRPVAVRVLHPACAKDMVYRERFKREVEVLRQLESPFVVSILADGEVDDRPYLVMSRVDGRPLHACAPLGRDAVLNLGEGLLSALGEMHAKRIVHRDLRPSGILITRSGPVLVDFGVARSPDADQLTVAGVGSHDWAAPEQLRGDTNTGPSSDLYSVGRLLAFAATGELDPDRQVLDDDLAQVVQRATAPRPSARFGSAAEMRTALQALARAGQALEPGRSLGKFLITEVLSDEGGMALVFGVENTVLRQPFVLKVLRPELRERPEVAERFLAEARIHAQLQHPNIVRVHDVLETGDALGLVMERVAGVSLQKRLAHGPLSLQETVDVLRPVLSAMAHAHGQGVVHRDLKPSNILLADARDGLRPVVIDFGVAKLLDGAEIRHSRVQATQLGAQPGTVAYMSPEQVRGRSDLDHRTDIWSLGVVLYECLSGQRPFTGRSDFEVQTAIVDRQFPPLPDSVPSSLRQVVDRALSPDPARRFQDCPSFERALVQAMEQPEPSSPKRSSPVRWVALLGAGGVALGAALCAGAGVVWWTQRQPPVEVAVAPLAQPASPAQADPEAFMPMVEIPAGSFWMGSPPEESGRDPDEARHRVELSQGFWMGRTEVTQRQYQEVMGDNPSPFTDLDAPVSGVSWYVALQFCNRLSSREGLDPAYDFSGRGVTWVPGANGYRLPTEAEWEYAARAGTGLRFAGSDNSATVAWTKETAARPRPVGLLEPNAWGLYDMSGNVYEWVWDWHPCAVAGPECQRLNGYRGAGDVDPKGVDAGKEKVYRGGSYQQEARRARVANRGFDGPEKGYLEVGFRVAKDL